MLGGRLAHRWHDRLVHRMSLVSVLCTMVMLLIAVAAVAVELIRPMPSQAALAAPLFDVKNFSELASSGAVSLDERDHRLHSAPKPPVVRKKAKPIKRDTAEAAASEFGPPGETGPLGIPVLVLEAYQEADQVLARNEPGCHIHWWTLAGIGHTESAHAESGRVYPDGTTRGTILGPVLDGHLAGNSVIKDTDHGVLDGDKKFDRAVGPMQFLPGTWRLWGVDANGDGKADPNNVFDASTTAAYYLCNSGRDLDKPDNLKAAILSYNNSDDYLKTVLAWATAYHDRAVAIANSDLAIAAEASASPTPSASASRSRNASATSSARSAKPSASASGSSSNSAGGSSGASGSPTPSGSTSSGGGLGGLISNLPGGPSDSASATTTP